MPSAFAAHELRKRYDTVDALRGVSLEVREGEVVGLLGPNGAGKSTLAKIACGLVRPTAGGAEVAGHAAGSVEARARIGYLAELFRFPGWATADELLLLHQRLAGSSGGPAEREELLALVGLPDAAGTRAGKMSKGMQQRLGIAQALVGSPRLLLLDEPTSALDPAGRKVVRRLLDEVRGRGVSVLLSSHLLSEVELVCDHVAILVKGEVVQRGTAAELRKARGVQVETASGKRLFEGAGRDDAPDRRGAGGERRERLRGRGALLDARGRISRGRRGGRDLKRLADARVIVGYAVSESLRRRVVAVVAALTAAFLVLYALGAHFAFDEVEGMRLTGGALVDEQALVGGTIFGLAMFAVLFLGSVLAIFLTNGVVRGDADAGLLQPLVVRPLGRGTLLVARWAGAAVASTVYVIVVYLLALAITNVAGDWTPGSVLLPALALALAVAIVGAISVLVSVFLASSAQGIAVFMIFGAGLVGGLLGQIGDALGSARLQSIADIVSTALPFEALYQAGLYLIATDETGFTRAAIELGPFGGSQEGSPGLVVFSVAYTAGALALAVAAFARRDL